MINVVHLTAHLGGGVGKALSELAAAHSATEGQIRHSIICLEPPEKSQFIKAIRNHGVEVTIAPDSSQLAQHIADADIVQIEWWNHPVTIAALYALPNLPMRLIAWCHVSGLCNPVIPAGLVDASQRFILTSPCSRAVPAIHRASLAHPSKIDVISSAAGIERLPPANRRLRNNKLSVGYLGSLNFAKLHPNFVPWMAAVPQPDFRVSLIGDPVNQTVLQRQAEACGRPDLFDFRGYTTDTVGELATLDVLAYLLNPRHYGTAENALVESMAIGVVPIVLNNPAERYIVEHGVTGLILSSGDELPTAMDWLSHNPDERCAIGDRASHAVRQKFTCAALGSAFRRHYLSVKNEAKMAVSFPDIFGSNPADWFLRCQGESKLYGADGTLNLLPNQDIPHDQFEHSKGSVFHFHRQFPDDPRLGAWSKALGEAQC